MTCETCQYRVPTDVGQSACFALPPDLVPVVQLGQKGFASIRRGVSPTDPACTLYKAQVTVEVVQ